MSYPKNIYPFIIPSIKDFETVERLNHNEACTDFMQNTFIGYKNKHIKTLSVIYDNKTPH